jgi:hypothetical protein
MGPELILIPIAYYGAALVAAGLLIAIVVKKSRPFGLATFALALVAAGWGALSSLPHWERVTAGLNFTLTGIGLGTFFVVWKFSHWLWKKLRGERGTVAHG